MPKQKCQAITKKGSRCLNNASNHSWYCHIHQKISVQNELGNGVNPRLSEEDFSLLLHSKEVENYGQSPIGKKFVSAQDIALLIPQWKEQHGPPTLPSHTRWQFEGNWSKGPNITGYNLGPNFAGVNFAEGNFNNLDFSGSILAFSNFADSNLEACNFTSAWLFRANFTRASLKFADLSKSIFLEANLNGTELWKADLSGASFYGANLENTRLLDAKLDGTYFWRARMNNTELTATQLHGSIGEERERLYFQAMEAYSRLKMNFESLGHYSDASWAYRKERRMRKAWMRSQGNQSIRNWDIAQATEFYLKWLADWSIELLCDYGESTRRVLVWIALLLGVIGPSLIDISGGIYWTESNQSTYSQFSGTCEKYLYIYFQYLLYMLDTITTASFSELKPRTDVLRVISGCMAMLGIFLVGLLGFVAGNRIRNA